MYKSLNEFEIWPDATTGFHGNHRVIMGKNVVSTLAPSFLIRSSSYLQVTRTFLDISDKFEIRPDRTKDCGVSCP